MLYLASLSLRTGGELKSFLDKQKLKEFIAANATLWEMLQGFP